MLNTGDWRGNVVSLAEQLRDNVHADFVPLKEGAVPQRQKPFLQQGEAREALTKIVQ